MFAYNERQGNKGMKDWRVAWEIYSREIIERKEGWERKERLQLNKGWEKRKG